MPPLEAGVFDVPPAARVTWVYEGRVGPSRRRDPALDPVLIVRVHDACGWLAARSGARPTWLVLSSPVMNGRSAARLAAPRSTEWRRAGEHAAPAPRAAVARRGLCHVLDPKTRVSATCGLPALLVAVTPYGATLHVAR